MGSSVSESLFALSFTHLTNTVSSLSGKIEAGFQVILLDGPCLLLGGPYYEPLLWFMIRSMDMHS